MSELPRACSGQTEIKDSQGDALRNRQSAAAERSTCTFVMVTSGLHPVPVAVSALRKNGLLPPDPFCKFDETIVRTSVLTS